VLKVKIITSNGDIGFPVQVSWLYCSKALLYICRSNISILIVPDEGYIRNAKFALNLISTLLLLSLGQYHLRIDRNYLFGS